MKMISKITLLVAALLLACSLTTAAHAQTTVEWMVLSISQPHPPHTSSAVAPATASAPAAVIGQALRPALVQAGFERVDVWSAATGDGEAYFLTRPVASLAELEQPGSLARALGPDGDEAWWSGLVGVKLELRAALVRARPDLSLAAPSASPLRQAVLTRVEIAPGHAKDFEQWLREVLRPAIELSGAAGLWVGEEIFGNGGPAYLVVLPLSEPLEGAAAAFVNDPAQQIAPERAPGVIAQAERRFIRYRPELSVTSDVTASAQR